MLTDWYNYPTLRLDLGDLFNVIRHTANKIHDLHIQRSMRA